jgi:hypothetical protein
MHEVVDLALITLAVGFVAVTATVTFFTWRAVKRVRRWRQRVEVALPQAFATPGPEALAGAWSHVHRTTLGARALVVPGPRGQALRMRRDLWNHVSAAETAVRAAERTGTPVGDLPHLVAHLKDLARRHDHSLVLVSKGVPVMAGSQARMETDRITGDADRVSGAVVEAFRADSAMDPDHLAVALDHETRAVSGGAARMSSLTGH